MLVSAPGGDFGLADLDVPLALDELAPSPGSPGKAPPPWEVEIGFGKGRYLLRRGIESPERRFLGIELVSEYHALLAGRVRRRGLRNCLVLRGEAHYLLSAVLPRGFADVVHVYFPDPWPKSRHHKRRLFDPETVDLVAGLLAPGGRLCFATDFIAYGELVRELLEGYPALSVAVHDGPWPEGPRTNYEAKYVAEGRPILRLEAALAAPPELHPAGRCAVLAATWPAAEKAAAKASPGA